MPTSMDPCLAESMHISRTTIVWAIGWLKSFDSEQPLPVVIATLEILETSTSKYPESW
jgi:hypothetical protein